MIADYTAVDGGSVLLLRPNNDTAREHLEDNTADEAQWFGMALVVEPRYMQNLIDNLEDEGFKVDISELM